MAGESQQTPDTPPDPTVATGEAIARALRAERDWVIARLELLGQRLDDAEAATTLRLQVIDRVPNLIEESRLREKEWATSQLDVIRERLGGIDRATVTFQESLTRVPTEVQREIAHLNELMQLALQSVAQRFTERDIRSEREARDSKVAVDAAFAAADKAASKQNESNSTAIAKSETATTETINKLAQLFASTQAALNDKVDDLKERVGKVESVRLGGREAITDQRGDRSSVYAAIGVGVSLILALIAIVGFVLARTGKA